MPLKDDNFFAVTWNHNVENELCCNLSI